MDQKRIQVGNLFNGKHFMKKYYNIMLFHSNSYLFYLPENISWRNIRTLPYSRKVNLKNVASNELHLVATFHRKSRNEFAMKASILMILINNLIKFDQMSRVGSRDRHAGWRSKRLSEGPTQDSVMIWSGFASQGSYSHNIANFGKYLTPLPFSGYLVCAWPHTSSGVCGRWPLQSIFKIVF